MTTTTNNIDLETLMEELVSDRQVLLSLPLTEEQVALGIPNQLVYIAGIVLRGTSTTTPPFSSSLQDQFSKLQEIYTRNIVQDTFRTFHLSPRIVPTKEQQDRIDADVARTIQELESRANAAFEELLESGKHPPLPKKSKTKKPKRSKRKNPPPPVMKQCIMEEEIETRISQEPSETLEDIVTMKIQSSFAGDKGSTGGNNIDNNDDDSSWIEVKKKGSNEGLHIAQNESTETNNDTPLNDTVSKDTTKKESSQLPTMSPETENELLPIGSENTHGISTNDVNVQGESIHVPEQSPTKTSVIREAFSLSSTDHRIVNNSTNTSMTMEVKQQQQQQQQQQIRRILEMEVAEKEQQLEKERLEHAQALRREKERSENIIQDLQLRLYISETRLKTYQDALEQHVESVASNLSNNYTPSSPLRRGGGTITGVGTTTTTAATTTGIIKPDPRSSPLISRVLGNQNLGVEE